MKDLEAALIQATSVEEAAIAASDAIDELMPGGAAISVDAGHDVGKAVEAFSGQHSFQAFVIAVLVSVGRVLGAWGRVRQSTDDVLRFVQAEREASEAIRGFIREQERGEFRHEAEVRSLFYRLVGIVADPATAVASLMSQAESEIDPLARACLFEGLLVAIMRSGMTWQDEVAMLKAAMQADPTVASRLTHVPFDYIGTSAKANRETVEEVLGVQIQDRDYGSCWPSELL